MSRSALIALLIWVGLLAALFVLERRVHWLDDRSLLEIALVPALAVYGASLAAVSIRRIVDPKLPTPILVWTALAVFYLAAALGTITRTDNRDDGVPGDKRRWYNRMADSKEPATPESEGMGRASAIASTILSLILYAGPIVWLVLDAQRRLPV